MRGVSADGRPLPVEWYFVPDDRAFVPFYNRFSSLNYTEGQAGDTSLGEDPLAPRPWWNGKFDRTADKDTPCGSEEVWQRGYKDDDPTSTTTRSGESACCVGKKGGLALTGGGEYGWPTCTSGSSWAVYYPAYVIFGAPLETASAGSSTATKYPLDVTITGAPLDTETDGSSTPVSIPVLTIVTGAPLDTETDGSSTPVFEGATVETDCCPGNPIPIALQARFVESDEPCWFGVTIPLLWDGSAWSGTGTVGSCGYDLTLTFWCEPGVFPVPAQWHLWATSSTLCVDSDGPPPFAVACAPLNVKFALGAGVWIGACSAEPILAGWIQVEPVP